MLFEETTNKSISKCCQWLIRMFVNLCYILSKSGLGTPCLPVACIEMILKSSFDRLSFSEMFLILQHIFWGTVSMDLKVADRSFLCAVSWFPLVTVLGITIIFQTWKQGQFQRSAMFLHWVRGHCWGQQPCNVLLYAYCKHSSPWPALLLCTESSRFDSRLRVAWRTEFGSLYAPGQSMWFL